ncbi:succinate-acetate transporter protein [Catenulispora sp. GAS73]|uniref:acetate uptake transporter n=1 Tax=Catenulispora sp. GAS73 TaxID=3156269 RepID=UPI0035110D1E
MSETTSTGRTVPPTPPTPAPTASSGFSVADPAPLGLAGFAMTTFVLSFVNANIIKESGAVNVVLALALFYGGTAQLLAGMWEFKRGNTFGATAFASFGAFWLSYWALVKLTPANAGDIHQAIGLYLLAWCIFTAYMTLAALKTNLAVLGVFVLLTLTFLFLAIGAFMNDPAPDSMTKVGGWFGIVTAAVAWYASSAAVVNATHGKTVLPTWPR